MVKTKDFLWAIAQMRKGKKVKRNVWAKFIYIVGSDHKIIDNEGDSADWMGLNILESDDWEISNYEPKVVDKKLKFNENQYTKGLTKEMVKQVEGIVFSIVKKSCTNR